MDTLALLARKKIVSTERSTLALNVTANGSPVSYRLRFSLNQPMMKFLSDPLLESTGSRGALRVVAHGTAAQGVAFHLTLNEGSKLTQQSVSTTVFTLSARQREATENRVAAEALDVIMVEYDDGSRWVITQPLPSNFLSTTKRTARQRLPAHDWPHPSFLEAFSHAKIVIVDDEPAPTEPQPTIIPEPIRGTIIEGKSDMPIGMSPVNTDDLRAALAMLNNEVSGLIGHGMNVKLWIDDKKQVRASVEVIYREDL